MSITVAKCLELPSFHEASVVGGSGGLNRTVSSVSVLEYADTSVLSDTLFIGNELIITAFSSNELPRSKTAGYLLAIRA